MAELMVKDGTWHFDGTGIRIVPGRDRGVHRLRAELGAVDVPLAAVGAIAYEPGRKGGRLRLRLREAADPLLHATGGALPDAADPYQVAVDTGRSGVAEYFADEVRNAALLEQVPDGPADRYLLPGPKVPLSASTVDGTATFDGERVRIEWGWAVSEVKQTAGPRELPLSGLSGVEWRPAVGLNSGWLRFLVPGAPTGLKPEHDPNCLLLWGLKKESGLTALLAAAVTARLPHPRASAEAAATPDAPAAAPDPPDAPAPGDPDALLRRLRELGELHRDGILTEDEFATAKSALLRRFG